MEFNGHLDMKATDIILKNYGLQDYGPVQKFVDQECIRLTALYTPYLNGILEKAATIGTDIGSGEINQNTPYARYQYYGELMVSSLTGSAYASKGESKILTDKDLEYNKSQHPQAGPFWFERMKADKKEDILKGAQKVANNEHN